MNRKPVMRRAAAWGCPRLPWPRLRAATAAFALLAGCASDSQRAEGNPSDDSASEGEAPNATETNFFTVPCDEDADCAEGSRCVQPSDQDGGPSLGRCVD